MSEQSPATLTKYEVITFFFADFFDFREFIILKISLGQGGSEKN